jgi:hypothetical protein
VKTCTKCLQTKALEKFYKGSARHGRMSWCKVCHGRYAKKYEPGYRQRKTDLRRERLYGLKPEAFKAMYERQRGRCASCDDEVDPVTVHIDHCHLTERVRGLLCRQCNIALGHLRDDPARINALGRYLEASGADFL